MPLLEIGHVIPEFSLPGTDGVPHAPWDYKQREHLVLLFTRSITLLETQQLLASFKRAYSLFREEKCALLAVTPDPVIANLEIQQQLSLPYPLVADANGRVITQYTQWDAETRTLSPCIVLADLYNALYQQWNADKVEDLPLPATILRELAYINTLCHP